MKLKKMDGDTLSMSDLSDEDIGPLDDESEIAIGKREVFRRPTVAMKKTFF